MQVRFWGTRGSVPCPGHNTLRYGGNTSCVEVRSAAGTLLVLDGGTGARALGNALVEEGPPAVGHLLIGHTHWDHIQGLPFFAPLFEANTTWHLYGPRDYNQSIRDVLAGQMHGSYFPISIEQFEADVHYHDLVEGSFQIDDMRITARYLNHPALTLGYRIECDDVTLVYATDHEPHGGASALESRAKDEESERHAAFIQGADLLIHDAQYTAAEYTERTGWGHSPVEFVIDAARRARVRSLALFHHDPGRRDDQLDRIQADARARAGDDLDVFAAAEGQRVTIEPRRPGRTRAPETGAAVNPPAPESLDRTVLLAVQDPDVRDALTRVAVGDGMRLVCCDDPASLQQTAASEDVALVLLQHPLRGEDALLLSSAIRRDSAAADDPPIVIVTTDPADVDAEAGRAAGVTDWMVWPFKATYAQTRMRCWLMRMACRWQSATPPSNEKERLEALHGLRLLDTPEEERFDRITRLAASLFDVPIALVSLVDHDRQWFKSHHGLDARETPREMAVCAHAILEDRTMVVPDTLLDDRFAENPLVTGPPHMRFYAGAALHTADGIPVGTLCLLDTTPRSFSTDQQQQLRDLAALVERELEAD